MSTPLTVLIADDHPLVRRGLREIIEEGLDCRIEEAGGGEAALTIIREKKPDVCVLDINMPVLDGFGVVRRMRQQHLAGEVIFLTMHKEEDLLNAAMDLNVKGYVLKEGAVSEIVDAIRSAAAGHRYISPALSDFLFSRRAEADRLREQKPGLDRLTPAERRVLKMIAEDNTSKEIADVLGLSPRTVENHRTNICAKLGVHGIHSLVKFAYDNRSKL
jgi:DNA-binding NarL/FixJ family response regulator